MSEYKRLTTNEPEDNVETMLNYAHSKDKAGVYLRRARK